MSMLLLVILHMLVSLEQFMLSSGRGAGESCVQRLIMAVTGDETGKKIVSNLHDIFGHLSSAQLVFVTFSFEPVAIRL